MKAEKARRLMRDAPIAAPMKDIRDAIRDAAVTGKRSIEFLIGNHPMERRQVIIGSLTEDGYEVVLSALTTLEISW